MALATSAGRGGVDKATDRTLTIAALGVVYGDIGTSPLYAFKACFSSDLGLPRTPANVSTPP